MKKIAIPFIYFSLVFSVLIHFLKLAFRGYNKESFAITEFLINYQGGFVRRGLLGELLLRIYHATGLSPYVMILLLCITAYALLCWFFFRSFMRKGYSIFVLPFVFFLGNPIINEFWVRKDVLMVVLFILVIYISQKKGTWSTIATNFILIIAILIHESIGFFGLPVLFLLFLSKNKTDAASSVYNIKSLLKVCLQLAPAILILLTTLSYHGSIAISQQIWDSWTSVEFPYHIQGNQAMQGSIGALSFSLKFALSKTFISFMHIDQTIAWIIVYILIYITLVSSRFLSFKLFNYKPTSTINQLNISNLLIFQFLAITPLILLGIDYGRWEFLWVSSSFALVLLINEEKLANLFPKVVVRVSKKLIGFLNFKFRKPELVLLLLCLIIGFPMFGSGLISFLKTNSLAVFLKVFLK